MVKFIKNKIKSFIILLIISFISLIGLSFINIDKTFANEDVKCYYQSAKIQNDTTLRSQKDFTISNLNVYNVFVNQVIILSIVANVQISDLSLKSDSEISFLDNTNELANGTLSNNYYVYSKQIKVSHAGEYNITLVGKLNEEIYFDNLNLMVYDEIESITINSSDNFINKNQDVKFDFIFNDSKELLNETNVKVAFANKKEEITVNNSDFSLFFAVKSLNCNFIVIDTSRLNDDWLNFNITITCNNKSANYFVEVLDLIKPTNAILSKTSVTYNLNDKTSNYYLYLDKNAKPIIKLIDNSNSISIKNIYKVESDKEGYDKIVIKFNLLKAIDFTNILFVISGETEDIYKSIGVSIIDTVTNVVLKSEKLVYNNKENVLLTTVVNGKDNFQSNVRWFVKDNEIEETSSELNLVKNGGTYNIYAIVDGVTSNTLTVVIKYSATRQLIWYIILGASILGAIILALTRKKKGDIDLFKPINENIDDLCAEIKLLMQNFSRNKAGKLLKNLTIIKEKCWQAYIENEENLYKIASQNLDIATKKLKKIVFLKDTSEQRVEKFNAILIHLEKASDALIEYRRICTGN